jgi:hypothetical protein
MDTIEELRHLMAAHQFGLHSAEIIARQDNNDSEGTLACCLAVRLLESPDEILIISLTQRGFQVGYA